MNLISLTTDFGYRDWFVGTMKGVIHSILPQAQIVDISHGIPSGDIRAGALALMASYRYFPRHTIHVGVVDPGVGSNRHGIAVRTEDYSFIGPDNGLFWLALADEKIVEVRRLENRMYFLDPVSATFHGRDIFAPVAAHLSRGVKFSELGPVESELVQLEIPVPVVEVGLIKGEIFYIDQFGNAVTNITLAHLGDIDPKEVTVHLAKHKPLRLGRYYQEAGPGKPIGLIGSAGFLEIAVNGASAADKLHLNIGDPVMLR